MGRNTQRRKNAKRSEQLRVMRPKTIDRGRRCENCRHYNNGDLAIQHYKAKRFEELRSRAGQILAGAAPAAPRRRLGDDDASQLDVARGARRLIERAGVNPDVAVELATRAAAPGGSKVQTRDFSDLDDYMRRLGVNYEMGDTFMRQGLMGLCLINAAPGDFVHKDYFCGGKYSQRVKVDDDHKHDETPEEARNRLGLDD